MNFRGVVYSKYKTIAELARKLGWTRQKTTNIVNMKQEPSLDEVSALAAAVDMSLEECAKFFLK